MHFYVVKGQNYEVIFIFLERDLNDFWLECVMVLWQQPGLTSAAAAQRLTYTAYCAYANMYELFKMKTNKPNV